MKYWLLASLLFLGQMLLAQKKIEILLNSRVQDDQIKKSQSILPIYHFEDTVVESFRKFGVTSEKASNLHLRGLPKGLNHNKMGYGFLYFSGADNKLNKGYIFMLIENFNSSHKNRLFYIDKNNNLDLSDDGPPLVFSAAKKEMKVELHNTTEPKGKHVILLRKIEYSKNPKYYNLLQEHYANHQGNKRFSKIYYGYKATRMNVLAGDFQYGNDSFTFALKDKNSDGLFNQTDKDLMYIGPYKKTINALDYQTLKKSYGSNRLEWNGKVYQIENILQDGSKVEMIHMLKEQGVNHLVVGKKIPKFTYTNFSLENKKSKKLRRQDCYFYFWQKESLTAEDTQYLGKIHREFPEVHLIAFNHGDKHKVVRIMHHYDQITWPIAFSSSAISYLLKFKEAPFGMYVGKRRRLQHYGIEPKAFYHLWRSRMK